MTEWSKNKKKILMVYAALAFTNYKADADFTKIAITLSLQSLASCNLPQHNYTVHLSQVLAWDRIARWIKKRSDRDVAHFHCRAAKNNAADNKRALLFFSLVLI